MRSTMFRPSRAQAVAAAVLALLAACSDDGAAPRPAPPAELLLLAGDGQVGPVGEPLPETLAVQVVDSRGRPLEGAAVIWTVLEGGGSLDAIADRTDAAGRSLARWTAGTRPGEGRVRAALDTLEVDFTADFTVGPVAAVQVEPASLSFTAVGDSLTASAVAYDRYGNEVSGAVFAWGTSDSLVATVSPAGVVRSRGSGTADVTATVSGTEGAASVVVMQVPSSLELSPRSDTLNALADTARLTAVVRDHNGHAIEGTAPQWSSLDPQVVEVDAAGRITARGTGVGRVRAVSGTTADTAEILVRQITAAVSVSPLDTLLMGVTRPLVATARDSNDFVVASPTFRWTSSIPAVASVDSTGRVTGVLPGEAEVLVQVDSAEARVPVVVRTPFSSISAGGHFTCATTVMLETYCWGANDLGQLGDGTLGSADEPSRVQGPPLLAVSAGWNHACGIEDDQRILCWGSNTFGQLGTGDTTGSAAPRYLAGLIGFDAISAGWYHGCGLASSGVTFCWGQNLYGEVGGAGSVLTPRAVSLSASTAVVAGGSHTCALSGSEAAWCWGRNHEGQLGNPNAPDNCSSIVTLPCSYSPLAVSGGIAFRQLDVGANHSCGLSAGAAYCWGWNVHGQIGNDGVADVVVPMPVAGGLTFATISAGLGHTCAVTPEGAVLCWGSNGSGELGDGTTQQSRVPTVVAGAQAFSQVSAGAAHTCGITTEGYAWCWGAGDAGQLGNGGRNASSVPVRVSLRR